ncbi:alpha/beta hydrolase [Cellulophaga sp. Hel_I_12]|uniref:alpha/beta hydrolase n=1 Tax=Cellulophaga sp. Hel_I_12 TaxID=1249972 RepID=UPI000647F817|nr:alpha/beta fold hydrolase [Cellulophaga sp. Hel_I_12]
MKNILNNKFLLVLIVLVAIGCKTENKNAENPRTATSFVSNALLKHKVISEGHPMAVWEKKAENPKGLMLFVHGRTWSGVPDFDLQVEGEDLSLMDGLVAQGYTTYAIDLRGYGGTPRDATEWATPNKASKDILTVLDWISAQNKDRKVHLFGWSMGSTLSLLATQQNATKIASLTVFGYWQDLDVEIPESSSDMQLEKRINTAESAASDFITPGSISQKSIDTYVKMALASDPIRVDWKNESDYNAIDPSLITVPVLLLQGEFDPLSPTAHQAKLFTRLKSSDKSWRVIAGGDHAAFMETPREEFIHSLSAFIDSFNE